MTALNPTVHELSKLISALTTSSKKLETATAFTDAASKDLVTQTLAVKDSAAKLSDPAPPSAGKSWAQVVSSTPHIHFGPTTRSPASLTEAKMIQRIRLQARRITITVDSDSPTSPARTPTALRSLRDNANK